MATNMKDVSAGNTFSVSRRKVLAGTGALVVSVSLPSLGARKARAQAGARLGSAVKPKLDPKQLDTWLQIGADGRVTVFYGKMDMGQGADVAIAQIVAEDLDCKFSDISVLMGDTFFTVNQGGASSSNGVQNGGAALRNAAAEARRVLVEHAAKLWGVEPGKLSVSDGVITVAGDPTKKATYAELVGGNYFNVEMKWNGQIGNGLTIQGEAKTKPVSEYKIVGKSYPRFDIPGKVYGTMDYVTDVRVPGMVHARMVLPPVAGASPVKIDSGSLKGIPGARVVHEKDFVAVVADREWDAIKAAEALKVTWSDAKPNFPGHDKIHDHIRKAPVRGGQNMDKTAEIEAALKGAARVVEAEYEWPFQSHASMGPGCAVVQINGDEATLWTGTQKSHYARDGVARMLGMPPDKVHGIWLPGPGSYGRNDAGDAAAAAAVVAKHVGKPVRMQGMRYEGTAWDPKGPASVHHAKAGLDAQGNVIAYYFKSKGFSRLDVNSNESDPRDLLAGQLLGHASKNEPVFNVPAESYAFPTKWAGWEVVEPLLKNSSPLRTSHFRDPSGPQIHFASEQFMDELALAVGADPIEFRLKYAKDARDIGVIKAAAEKVGWKPRSSPANKPGGTNTVSGRGFAYASRSGTTVAMIAEVDVDRSTGKIWARKFTVAHDCGLVVNPDGLRNTIEGNVVQALSRSLWEEVQFDNNMVISTDWAGYPILDSTEAPEAIDVVLVNRPDVKPAGAGEATTRPVSAAIANAVFDATGVRIRRAPLTPDRVKGFLGQA